jgi:sirohydrochlorin ferrochelatase
MSEKPPALVIAAHGSKSSAWAEAVGEFAKLVRESPGIADVFASVSTGFIENSTPGLAEAVDAALGQGVGEVIVVPLFLTASNHQAEDVPGILGVPQAPAHVRRRLAAEGVRILPEGLPVRIQSIGDLGEILHRNVARRVALEVKDRAHEAIVLVAYGSALHHDQWERLMHEVRLRLLQDGFGGVAHAYCGHVVQLSPEPTFKAISSAAQQAGVRKVHVVPLLMARSDLQTGPIAIACQAGQVRLQKLHVQLRYAADAILPDGDLAQRVAFRALEAVGITPPILGPLSGSGIRKGLQKA